MAIYLTGSVAYDRIMNFPGKFVDNILPDQIHNLNVSFFIDNLDEQLGGNAGNIAYSLHLLNENPVIVATVGKDYEPYKEVLMKRGLPLDGITVMPDVLTASAYITTDQTNNQITAFHAAAMMFPSKYDFPELSGQGDIALIGPSNMTDMNAHPALYRKKGVRYIYDPSQQIPVLSAENLNEAIDGAWILIGNDYEIQLISNITGRSMEDLAGATGLGLITTLGEKGSLILGKDGNKIHIKPVPVGEVKDPTGAGDSYRSGLIKGLVQGKTLEESAKLGATSSAFCIECHGTQTHKFSVPEFYLRHEAAFGVSG